MARLSKVVAVAWFRSEDYGRIREISDDEMIPVFADWEAKMTKMVAQFEARGIACKKMIIDPDKLLAFATRSNLGKIDTKARSAFAALLLSEQSGARH
jgi:hypothetical protein